MSYRTVYDITTEPLFDVEAAWLAGGFIALGVVWRLVQQARDSASAKATADARQRLDPPSRKGLSTPKVLVTFGVLIALIGIGLMGWDRWRLVRALENGEAQVVEGAIQSYGTERVRTANTKKIEYNLYERFYIGDSIWFGYYRNVGQAGFHNGKSTLVPLKNGLMVRATYLHADGTDDPPRIVVLEIAE